MGKGKDRMRQIDTVTGKEKHVSDARRPAALAAALGMLLATGVCAAADFEQNTRGAGREVASDVQAAVEAGRNTPRTDYDALFKGEAVTDFIAANKGETGAIEDLRQNGQGELYAPGRAEADACWQKNDPRCLAVQMVDKGSTEKPTLDPDLAGDLIGGRNEIVDNAGDWVNVDGTGSSTGTCRGHTTVVKGEDETLTCEVRTNETAGGSTEETCSHRFDEIHSETSVWACETTYRGEEDKTCSIPVVVNQTLKHTLACLEGRKDPESQSCPVVVTPEQKEKHYAACVKPAYRSVTRTCTRRLVVQATSSCKIGATQQARNTDYAGLGEDAVPGADTLLVRSVCVEKGTKLILMTNSAAGIEPDISWSTTADIFETVEPVTGGQVRLKGEVVCNKADCIATVSMTVYRALGPDHVLQGDVSVRLPFTRFVKGEETEHWSETCTGI